MLHGIEACSRGVCICYSTNRKFSIHYTHTTWETGTVPLDEISRSPPIHQFKHAYSSNSESSRLHVTVNGSLPFVSATRRTAHRKFDIAGFSPTRRPIKLPGCFSNRVAAALGRWLARVRQSANKKRFRHTRVAGCSCKPLRNQLAPNDWDSRQLLNPGESVSSSETPTSCPPDAYNARNVCQNQPPRLVRDSNPSEIGQSFHLTPFLRQFRSRLFVRWHLPHGSLGVVALSDNTEMTWT